MGERQFSEPRLAALYDPLCGRESRDDLRFYLPLIMSAKAVLDVGCGTGALLHWARESGYRGRLVGLDAGRGMLELAQTRSDIEWILGDLSAVSWDREFDLAVMTGHAFQQLVDDDVDSGGAGGDSQCARRSGDVRVRDPQSTRAGVGALDS